MKNEKVLVVDDEESIRKLYCEALQNAGLEVISAKNGVEAVQLALTEHPAVILMDIQIPDIDGIEAVRRIRLDDWGKTARVIYLTNFSEPEDVVKAFEQKPEEYIVKSNTEVKEVINQVRMAIHSN